MPSDWRDLLTIQTGPDNSRRSRPHRRKRPRDVPPPPRGAAKVERRSTPRIGTPQWRRLTHALILSWADDHYRRRGFWPRNDEGPVLCARGEKWIAIESALRKGSRGLPGGDTLARLLQRERGYRNPARLPPLRRGQILAWADEHHDRTGRWPLSDSGPIESHSGESWPAVESALRNGRRGLPGDESIAGLLLKHRGVRHHLVSPRLTIRQILAWADAHHRRTGRWPSAKAGVIREQPEDTWSKINAALIVGVRGLPGGGTLPLLLARHRGVPHRNYLPRFTVREILAWADAHHRRTGQWPRASPTPIPRAPHDTWSKVDRALFQGSRGLPGGSSLARLLERHRGLRNTHHLRPLTLRQILAWADEHHRRTGAWPTLSSGVIPNSGGESWVSVNTALVNASRGLSSGFSLAGLLSRERGARKLRHMPPHDLRQILAWADEHRERTGRWPGVNVIEPIPGTTHRWRALDAALRNGSLGLPGGFGLATLLDRARGVRNIKDLPRLTHTQILRWADAHRKRTGRWPHQKSGAVADAPGESWGAIQSALMSGYRGLPPGSSIMRVLAKHRGVRNRGNLPPLTPRQILAWARRYRELTGRSPTAAHGPIVDAPGESWDSLRFTLMRGSRGLPGGYTLGSFLAQYDPARSASNKTKSIRPKSRIER